jgi:tripartite ATP-independent transporter DctP family solute receptor
MMTFILSACGGSGSTEESAAGPSAAEETAEPIIINFGTNQPVTHVVAAAYQGFVDELNGKSNGAINATAYFSEQLGTEKEMVDMVANDINDMISVPGVSALSVYYPSLQIFDAPYVFSTPKQMLNFANTEATDDLWDDMAAKTNIRVLGVLYFGQRYLTCNDINVQTPANLAGVKLRVVDSEITLANGKALGANPTPLAYSELYLALQQGIVDAQENPLANILSAKFYEVQNTLVKTCHVTAGVAVCMSETKWKSIPEDMQKVIQTATENLVQNGSKAVMDKEEEMIAELESHGMKVITPDVAAFKKAAYSVIEQFQSNWAPGLYELSQNTPTE